MIGVSEAIPATRMPTGSGPVTDRVAVATGAHGPGVEPFSGEVASQPSAWVSPPSVASSTSAAAPVALAVPQNIQQPTASSAAAIRVSTGAYLPGQGRQVVDPFSGHALGQQSAPAQTARSAITGIRADVGEATGWRMALLRGEIGLQAPLGANVRGPDFLTAEVDASGQVTLIVTDVKTSTVGRFPAPRLACQRHGWLSYKPRPRPAGSTSAILRWRRQSGRPTPVARCACDSSTPTTRPVAPALSPASERLSRAAGKHTRSETKYGCPASAVIGAHYPP